MNKIITVVMFVIGFTSVANANTKGATLNDYMKIKPYSTSTTRYFYGADKKVNFFDYYKPKSVDERKSAIVIIHGGCWDSRYEGFSQVGNVVDFFLSKGFVVFNIEYTRGDEGGGYPKTYIDVSNALLKITSVIEEKKITKNGVSLIGHSAGGHLAIWAASGGAESHAKEFLDKVKINKVIGLGAIVDLSVAQQACPNISRFGGVDAVAGKDQKLTSPILMKNNSPIFLINGEKDDVAPPLYAKKYFDQQHSHSVKYSVVSDATHYDLMSSRSGVFDIVLDALN